MTKAQNEIFNRYQKATATELWQVYDNYSHAKVKAMQYCRDLMNKFNGYGLRILGANCHQFSVAFRFEDAQTGVCKMAYITRDNDRYFEI